MKLLSYWSLVIFLAVLSLPVTADAFSRRSHQSEVGGQTTTFNTSQTNTGDVSPQAVPEPPALLLMSIGIGLLALGSVFKRIRRTSSSAR